MFNLNNQNYLFQFHPLKSVKPEPGEADEAVLT